MAQPLLVVVGGPPGSGTSTLAHELARAIPCPAICRDEIKEGLVHGSVEYTPAQGDDEAYRTLELFFGVVGYLVDAGVSLVAESSFQHALWEPGLAPLLDRADVRIVHCRADPAVMWERIEWRTAEEPARSAIHGGSKRLGTFDAVHLAVPSLDVDTTNDYEPTLGDIVAFVTRS